MQPALLEAKHRFKHKIVELPRKAGFLKGRHKLGKRNHPLCGVFPADQPFRAGHRLAAQLVFRLVIHLKMPLLQRGAAHGQQLGGARAGVLYRNAVYFIMCVFIKAVRAVGAGVIRAVHHMVVGLVPVCDKAASHRQEHLFKFRKARTKIHRVIQQADTLPERIFLLFIQQQKIGIGVYAGDKLSFPQYAMQSMIHDAEHLIPCFAAIHRVDAAKALQVDRHKCKGQRPGCQPLFQYLLEQHFRRPSRQPVHRSRH